MIYDFHTHTFFSDGELSPIEAVRRAIVKGYAAIAITDHVSDSNCLQVLDGVMRDCALACAHWPIRAFAGVELTHIPPAAIPRLARLAKENGAAIVVVHGETPVEPVPEGTNMAAVSCPDVDVLAHPGLITAEEARAAAANGTFLEITARKGHSLTNGHVAKIALVAGARLLVNSDAHSPDDLLVAEMARKVALGSGLGEDALEEVLRLNPLALVERLESAGAG